VRRTFGVALYAAQIGETPPIAKPLRGFGGAGVLELIDDDAGGTYRAVYTVRYATAGLRAARVSEEIQTGPRNAATRYRFDQGTVEARRRNSCTKAEGRPTMKQNTKRKAKRAIAYEDSSGNVFADLGLRNPKQELLKAKLTVEIYRLLKKRGVTQHEAAKLLGTTQAQVSALMRCKPVSVSVGRLMEFLTVLGQDIEVTVKPATRRKAGNKTGDMSVVVQGA
jgi:predicted XRE-type DNA-binding protein